MSRLVPLNNHFACTCAWLLSNATTAFPDHQSLKFLNHAYPFHCQQQPFNLVHNENICLSMFPQKLHPNEQMYLYLLLEAKWPVLPLRPGLALCFLISIQLKVLYHQSGLLTCFLSFLCWNFTFSKFTYSNFYL